MLIGVVSQYDLLVVDNWEKSIQEINNPCQLERASFKKKTILIIIENRYFI